MVDYVYLKVSRDEYELPEAVACNAHEMARICKTTVGAVQQSVSRRKRGHGGRYIAVDVSEVKGE